MPSTLALVVALARPSVAILDHVVRQQPAEERRPLARPVRQDARHQAAVVVVEHRQRHAAEEREGMDVAVGPRLGRRRRVGADVTGIAVRQVEGEEVRLLLDPADHHQRLAEVRLGVTGRMVQRHEHLPAAPLVLAQIGLHDGVAAGEPVLVAQPVEDPLRGVTLLARAVRVLAQPSVDDLGEPVQLRPLHRRRPPVAGRHRIDDHLVDAVARDPEVTRDGALAHALPEVGVANLPIHLHGENAPALPAARKDNVADFYAARRGLIPPLPWQTFSPPFSSERRPMLGQLRCSKKPDNGQSSKILSLVLSQTERPLLRWHP